MAWKKQKPNKSILYFSGLAQPPNCSSERASYVPSKFYLKPDGGSKVILTEFYRTETGKAGVGIEVSHNLKSLCLVSSIYSTIASRAGIQETAKWQFMRSTHPPRFKLSLIITWALGPCPRPNEIFSDFLVMFMSAANLSKSATGSEPVDNTKISGVVIALSLNDLARLNTGGSTNCLPIYSIMKF